MIERFGKAVQMRTINRNMDGIKAAIDKTHKDADNFYKEAESEIRKCRICGATDSKLFLMAYEKYEYCECMNCKALFLHNLPDTEKMYSGDDNSANCTSYIDDAVYERRIEMISAPKAEFILDVCKQTNVEVNEWLDIGCGGGEILSYLKRNTNVNGQGIESDIQECSFANSKGLIVHNSFIDSSKKNETNEKLIRNSDVISFFNVLEHIENPVAFIDYLYENMHSGAVMAFEVPRHPSVASFANLTCKNMIYRHIVPPIHLQIFSEQSIEMILNNRFEMIGKWEFGQGYTDLVNNLMLLSNTEENDIYYELIKQSNAIQFAIDESGLADQMLIIARKK